MGAVGVGAAHRPRGCARRRGRSPSSVSAPGTPVFPGEVSTVPRRSKASQSRGTCSVDIDVAVGFAKARRRSRRPAARARPSGPRRRRRPDRGFSKVITAPASRWPPRAIVREAGGRVRIAPGEGALAGRPPPEAAPRRVRDRRPTRASQRQIALLCQQLLQAQQRRRRDGPADLVGHVLPLARADRDVSGELDRESACRSVRRSPTG